MAEKKPIEQIIEDRRRVTEIDPREVKRLSLQYGLTQGQVRGLMMEHGEDPAKFAEAAETLRRR
jgi:hypothetical protein